MNKIKVLFLAANPTGTLKLQLDEEIRQITNKIRASEYRDMLELVSAWAVRPDDLIQLLNEHRPQIVHFSGHGSEAGEIMLTGEGGVSKPISSAAIQALFKTLKDNIRVVMLNVCFSRTQAQAITEVIDCAIGMNAAIGDQAAIIFAASFYRAIGFGRSVQEAYEQGKAALLLEGIPEDTTPEMLLRPGADPSRLFLLSTDQVASAPLEAPPAPSYRDLLMKLVNYQKKQGRSVRYCFWVLHGDDQETITVHALEGEGQDFETEEALIVHPNTEPLQLWKQEGYISVLKNETIQEGEGIFRLTPAAAQLRE